MVDKSAFLSELKEKIAHEMFKKFNAQNREAFEAANVIMQCIDDEIAQLK